MKLYNGLTKVEKEQYENGYEWCTISEIELILSDYELEDGETERDLLLLHIQSMYSDGYIPSHFDKWKIIKKYNITKDDYEC